MITGSVADVTVSVPGKLEDFLNTVVPEVVRASVLSVPSPYNSNVALPTFPIPFPSTVIEGNSVNDKLQEPPNLIIWYNA